MDKKSKKNKDKKKNKDLGVLDGAKLREEYESQKEADLDDITDEIAKKIIKKLPDANNYIEVLLGLHKAYLNVLLQLVEENDLDPDDYLETFTKEADDLFNNYLENNNMEIDPVLASGSYTMAASHFLSVLDDEDDDE